LVHAKGFGSSFHAAIQSRMCFSECRHAGVGAAAQALVGQQGKPSFDRVVRSARRYRTVTIQAGRHTLTAAEAAPDELARAPATIHGDARAH
jgi:hypothetical protein